MTNDSNHPMARPIFRLVLFLAWFVLVVSLATLVCFGLVFLTRNHVQSENWRTAITYGCGIIWMALVAYMGFLLPSRFLKRRVKNGRQFL